MMPFCIYEEFKLYFVLLRALCLNYLRYDYRTSTVRTDYSLQAKIQFTVWCTTILLLAWNCFPSLSGESIVMSIAASYEYAIVIVFLLVIPYWIFSSQDKFIDLLTSCQSFEENSTFLGLNVTKGIYYRFHCLFNNVIFVLALLTQILYIMMILYVSQIKEVVKMKFLYVSIYSIFILPKNLMVLISERCKALNNLLDDGLEENILNCVLCNRISEHLNCAHMNVMCSVHKLCCAQYLFEGLKLLMKKIRDAYNKLFCAFIFGMIMELGIDLCNILVITTTNTSYLELKIIILLYFISIVTLGSLIFFLTIDTMTSEFSRTGMIVHRYYIKYSKTKWISNAVRQFSLVILDDVDMHMLVYDFQKENMLSLFHTSALTASLAVHWKVKLF